MSSEIKQRIELEIVHVLFLDIVAYSKLRTNEQRELVEKLNQVVRSSNEFQKAEAAGRLIKIPSGDGMALVFYKSPEQPVECALEISVELQKHPESTDKPQLRLRMGVHSGPISAVTDVNDRTNAAGIGINIAQRVMDCGDAGHILLSKRVAEDLEQYGDWESRLHDLGEVEVKHGVRIHVFNLYTEEVGNPEVPEKLRVAKPKDQESSDASARRGEGFWVAVLPFKYVGANADLSALAEGLSEETVTGLSRFSYLRVIARSSTLGVANESGDVRALGKKLGARYVMEGSLRQAGTKLRLAVQLVDATSGAHLWAENYERSFSPETIFELQDDLVPRIVSTVADQYGALVHSMSESLRGRSAGQYSAHEAVLRAFGFWERMTPQEHAEVRDILEAAVASAPDHSDCLAELASIYWAEYAFGYNLKPDPVGRALTAAKQAVALAPTSHFAHCAFATSLFFQKDYLAFRVAADRALALNRMDSATAAILGNMIAYAGDWECGLEIGERAMELNPHHAGWYHYVAFCDAYRRRDYRAALSTALKVNMPAYHWPHVYLAAVCGQLGDEQRGRAALREVHALLPNFGAIARDEMGKWLDPELTEHLLDGLRKAGLEISGEDQTLPATAAKSSAKIFSQEAFWVAVLPFKSSGGTEIESFADGLSEDITTGLSRFRYLSVVARAAAARLKGRAGDERTLGAELGARYVVEGGIRKQGSAIRVSARLIDTASGAQLWAETYDRDLEGSSIFAAQDDIAARIVATVADSYGVLVHSIREATQRKGEADFTPADWQFQWFAYREQITPASHGALRSRLERATQSDHRPPDLWACLAQVLVDEYAFNFPGHDDTSLDRALTAARRSVELDRANQFAMVALAQTHFFRQDLAAFRPAAERAIALNPLNTDALGILGLEIVHTGEFDRGTAIVRRAMELNPNHAGWMHFAPLWNHFRKGEYEQALACANRVDVPGLFWPFLVMASACGHLGRRTEAAAAVRDLLALDPEFATHARSNVGTWHFASGLMEPILEGLRKAGLQIP
jgi:adenylate cyclase